MDLQKRVMDILDGRIKRGAAKPRRAPRKKKRIIPEVPPSRAPRSRDVPTVAPFVGNPANTGVSSFGIHDEQYFTQHYPTQADVQEKMDMARPDVKKALSNLLTGEGCPSMCSCGGGVRIAGMQTNYGPHMPMPRGYGRQMPKNKGGRVPKCRKGCKHIRCAASKRNEVSSSKRNEVSSAARGGIYGESNMMHTKARANGGVRARGIKQPKTLKAGKDTKGKKRKESEWVRYVKEFAKLNDMKYGEALKKAGPSYHAQA